MIAQKIRKKRVSSTEKIGKNRKTVLFLCTHNFARSQMAEGLTNSFFATRFEALEPSRVHPMTIQVMDELGIDISNQESKHINEFQGKTFDYVVTVCDHAQETCPYFPGKQVIHQSFYDPVQVEGTEEEQLAVFRRVRDNIKTWLFTIFEEDRNR